MTKQKQQKIELRKDDPVRYLPYRPSTRTRQHEGAQTLASYPTRSVWPGGSCPAPAFTLPLTACAFGTKRRTTKQVQWPLLAPLVRFRHYITRQLKIRVVRPHCPVGQQSLLPASGVRGATPILTGLLIGPHRSIGSNQNPCPVITMRRNFTVPVQPHQGRLEHGKRNRIQPLSPYSVALQLRQVGWLKFLGQWMGRQDDWQHYRWFLMALNSSSVPSFW